MGVRVSYSTRRVYRAQQVLFGVLKTDSVLECCSRMFAGMDGDVTDAGTLPGETKPHTHLQAITLARANVCTLFLVLHNRGHCCYIYFIESISKQKRPIVFMCKGVGTCPGANANNIKKNLATLTRLIRAG